MTRIWVGRDQLGQLGMLLADVLDGRRHLLRLRLACRTSGAAGAAEVLNHPMSRWSAVRRFADEPSEEHRKIFLASRRVQERLSLAD